MFDKNVIPGLEQMMKNAIIVAAHPDDEILWFSSIITQVKTIIICYVGQNSRKDWTQGRTQALRDYPLRNTVVLNLELAEVFNCSDWRAPRLAPHGVHLKQRCNREKYELNYRLIYDRLNDLISSQDHVFTHNPWGEYGHEEHVQVFRALNDLKKSKGFSLWFTNYVSNHSMPLMLKYVQAIEDHSIELKTDQKIAAVIRDHYQKHACWTWYPHFKWCDKESFIRLRSVPESPRTVGRTIPLTFIDVGDLDFHRPQSKTRRMVMRGMRKLQHALK